MNLIQRLRQAGRGLSLGVLQQVSLEFGLYDRFLPKIWPLREKSNLDPYYVAQIGQDLVLDQLLFQERRGGTFVDVGAHDGITYSNTWFFERIRNWNGLCVEAHPGLFAKLRTNRTCLVSNSLVSSRRGTERFTIVEGHSEMLSGVTRHYSRKHLRRISRELLQHGGASHEVLLEAMPLQHLLDESGIRSIDLLCVDVEGSESEVFLGLDFEKTKVRVILVERNYSSKKVWKLLNGQGFIRLLAIGWDDVYVARNWITGDW